VIKITEKFCFAAEIQMELATDRLRIKDRGMLMQVMRWEGGGNYKINPMTPAIASWHEFGHAYKYLHSSWLTRWMKLVPRTNKKALEWENRI
jgi:hypothetical protein